MPPSKTTILVGLLLMALCWGTLPARAVVGAGPASLSSLFRSWRTAYHYVRDDLDVSVAVAPNLTAALTQFDNDLINFVVAESVVTDTALLAPFGGPFVQLPLTASAIVMGYHLPELNATTDTLVFDLPTLARIWRGDITLWNDSAIAALNPAIALKLPGEPIELLYKRNADSLRADVTAAFTKALCHDADFDAAFEAAGGSLYDLLGGSGYANNNLTNRRAHLAATPYTLSYFRLVDTMGISYSLMKDANGTTVAPSATTVQSALAWYRTTVFDNQFVADISNGGNGSWPLTYLAAVVIVPLNASIATNCPQVKDLLDYISWTQVNDYAVTLAQNEGFESLDIAYRRRLMDTLGTITCDDVRATSSAYVIGLGAPQPVYTAWAAEYRQSNFKMKFFTGDALTSTRYMQTGDIDFGSTVVPLSAETLEPMPDVIAVKVTAHAYCFTYNIPELVGQPPMNLSWEVVSDIYLNKIKNWNDTRIRELNPAVAHLLPNQDIIIPVVTTAQTSVHAVMQTLSALVPEFNAIVGPVALPTYPVAQQDPNRTIITSGLGAMQTALDNTKYIFSWWVHFLTLNSAPTLQFAQIPNAKGTYVTPNDTTIVSAITNHQGSPTDLFIMLSPGPESYPMVTFNALMVRSKTMPDLAKAQALVDWIYWTQTDTSAMQIARSGHMVVASMAQTAKSDLLDQLATVHSQGKPAFSLAGCIYEGTICAGQGACVSSECVCPAEREGDYCERKKTNTTALGVILGVALGAGIPGLILLLVAAVALGLGCWLLGRSRGRGRQDWEIDFDELEMGDILGSGGYGEVYRAQWKGTDVAVKLIAAEQGVLSKEMQRAFKDEVEVMTALRHPHVVLFMAACTRPPRMCIVMEFMALGSLFDLIHNELISDLPLPLIVRLALQAAKGMHFLHSSGIVHRDLKSLNLLLDAKWNLKVSDFGLTRFKGDLKKNAPAQQQGSIHWMAPETLSEQTGVDYVLADVYAFGIILWELLTREQPYAGLTPAAIAVAVIRDNARPAMTMRSVNPDYEKLITDCWHRDPSVRPTFLEVMTRLSAMIEEGGGGTSSSSSRASSGGYLNQSGRASTASSRSTTDDDDNPRIHLPDLVGGVPPPEGEVALVFTDIAKAASLWSTCPNAMRDATLLHNTLLRSLLAKHRGYEAVFIKEKIVGEGSFCMAFSTVVDALSWCGDVQRKLLHVDWPEELLDQTDVAEEIGGVDDRIIFRGLRVRMGVHAGVPKLRRDPMSRRVEYLGPPVVAAARVTVLAQGGQVLLTRTAFERLRNTDLVKERRRFARLGATELGDEPGKTEIFEMRVRGLEPRYFGNFGAAVAGDAESSSDSDESRVRRSKYGSDVDDVDDLDADISDRTVDLEKLASGLGEDTFLTGANLVRWVIRYEDIQLGDQIGIGSYGVVFKGTWKGIDVAVKRFIKQRLDERHLLEFRAEVACLSEMRHPNIVLFIGACLRMPNLCLVTEWVKQGSLKALLSTTTIKLPWQMRLRMLRDAARGMHYLHTLEPCIIHRDLKTSNLLVDESWNVKVADFGFARIKEENITMTRCGTPAWTAPEVIRGEHYSELADVYSFGIIMWEMATRKQPYAGRNFMGVTLDVLEGKRPQVPADCPAEYRAMMVQCWKGKPEKRPSMEEVLRFLNSALGELFTEEDDESV